MPKAKKRTPSKRQITLAALLDLLPAGDAAESLALLSEGFALVAIGRMAADGILTAERGEAINVWLHIHNDYVRDRALALNTHQLAIIRERLSLHNPA